MIEIIFVQKNTNHPAGFVYTENNDNDWWLFTITNTPAFFMVDGERVVMPANTAVLYPPYAKMKYGSLENESFGDDWIRFRTDEPFICKGEVPFSTPFRVMEHLFVKDLLSMLAAENFFQNMYKEFTILSLFQVLFNKLLESLSNKSSDFRELALQQLHMNILSNPAFPWNVSDMAKQLYICPRHLQKLYQKRYGISCMEDVIKHRLLLAKEKIASSKLPIYKIAEQCGYSNTEHFSRQFKNRFGVSPKAYREEMKKEKPV